jgi:hypothetical protein
MKYWFDFEFEEDGITIEPISVGFVSEDGREYYAEFVDYDRDKAPEWLRRNVLPLLDGPIKDKQHIATQLIDYLGDSPEIWGWFGSYDWVALCQLYGTMMDLPEGWPMFQLETMNYVKSKDQIIPRTTTAHHALADAIWQKEMWESLSITL